MEQEFEDELEEMGDYEPEFDDDEREDFEIGSLDDDRFFPTDNDFIDALGF